MTPNLQYRKVPRVDDEDEIVKIVMWNMLFVSTLNLAIHSLQVCMAGVMGSIEYPNDKHVRPDILKPGNSEPYLLLL